MLAQHYGQRPYQHVLYVGAVARRLPRCLKYPTLSLRYEVIDIRTLNGAALLASAALEDNLLALLCRLDDPRATVRRILERIAGLAGAERDAAPYASREGFYPLSQRERAGVRVATTQQTIQ